MPSPARAATAPPDDTEAQPATLEFPPAPPRARAVGVARYADLGVATVVAVVAAWAALALPEGSLLRLALAMPMVFWIPGYLVLEAMAPRGPRGQSDRAWRAAAAIAVSPAVAGLAALATALYPGGFRPAAIVGMITAVCLVAAAQATRRRWLASPRSASRPHEADAPDRTDAGPWPAEGRGAA